MWNPFQKSKPAAPAAFTFAEVADLLEVAGGDKAIQEMMTLADFELAREDIGWIPIGEGRKGSGDLEPRTRKATVIQNRLAWLRDPLAKQAVRLWTDYAFGDTGVTYKTEESDGEGDGGDQKTLDIFMRSRLNRTLTGYAGQQRLSKKLLCDGELFFAIVGTGEEAKLRVLDCLQITDIITDPDDDEHVLCYRRLTASGKVLFYADWTLDEDGRSQVEGMTDPHSKETITLQEDTLVLHLAFDTIGRRGNGLLSCVYNWSNVHRKFMESRVGIQQALAKFVFKLTAKGGPSALAAMQKKLQSSVTQTGLAGTGETNPTNSAGATWLQNLGADLQAMPRGSGAGDAKEDGNQLKLQVCAGTGIMLHYFGDPSTGNLATATAMELPMLKTFAGYQQLWINAWRDIFTIVLELDDAEAMSLDVDLPPILADDLEKLGTFITQLATAFPEVKVPEVLKMLLISLGLNNVDEVLKAIQKKRDELDAEPPPPTVPNPAPNRAPGAPATSQEAAALNRLAEALEESNAAVAAADRELAIA